MKLKSYPMDARDEFIYKTDLTRRTKQAFKEKGIKYPQLSSDRELTNGN